MGKKVPIIVAVIGLVGVVLGGVIQGYFNLLSIREKGKENEIREKGEEYELWSVEGKLSLKDNLKFDNKDVIMSIIPPGQDLYEDGTFFIVNVPIKLDDKRKPSLLIKKTGYTATRVILKIKPHIYFEELKLTDYSISFDEKNKLIKIEKPIILVPESEEITNSGGIE